MNKSNPYTKSAIEVITSLRTNAQNGLSENQVQILQSRFGRNELPKEKQKSLIIIFAKQFNDLFSYFLFIAAIISFFLGEIIDVAVILAAIIINGIVGYLQENKARKTVEELKEYITVIAKVIRNGNIKEVKAEELVPGDIIELSAGDKVPADARLVETFGLETREEVLTGESMNVLKDAKSIVKEDTIVAERKNMVFMGTLISKGLAKAIVTATGLQTEFGKITKLVKETKEKETPLKIRLRKLSLWIGAIAFICCLIIVLAGVIAGKSVPEMFVFAVALAVSAIPEGLLIVVTIILTIGMRRILKRQAVVSELVAAETLGSTTVICSDKTGTITTGEMRADYIYTADNIYQAEDLSPLLPKESDLEHLMLSAVLCSEVQIENPRSEPKNWKLLGEATEKSLVIAARDMGMYANELRNRYRQINIIPFDADRKYMASENYDAKSDEYKAFLKGGVEVLLRRSRYFYKEKHRQLLTDEDRKTILQAAEKYSSQEYRVIGTAFKILTKEEQSTDLEKEIKDGLIFTGFVAVRDPVRPQIKDTIKKTMAAGIKVKMITGDHRLTALSIATDIGILASEKEIITSEDFDKLPPEELEARIQKAKIFARVSPKHKLQIIDALQKQGEVVAMTGDGVNDVPALKAADIGVAMGSGTEVAKETADIVLLDNNFKTITAAVEEGRLIFNNLRKVILYLLSDSFSEIALVLGTLFLGLPLPLLPTQILWINLVTDSPPSIALAFESAEKDIMKDRPRRQTESIINREMKVLIGVIGLLIGLMALGIFWWKLNQGYDLIHARTLAFTTLSVATLFCVFSARSLHTAIWRKNILENKILLMTFGLGLILQIMAVYLPAMQVLFHTTALNGLDWGVVFGAAFLVVVVIEICKQMLFRRKTN